MFRDRPDITGPSRYSRSRTTRFIFSPCLFWATLKLRQQQQQQREKEKEKKPTTTANMSSFVISMFVRWNPLDRAHTTHTQQMIIVLTLCVDLKDQSNVPKKDWPSFFSRWWPKRKEKTGNNWIKHHWIKEREKEVTTPGNAVIGTSIHGQVLTFFTPCPFFSPAAGHQNVLASFLLQLYNKRKTFGTKRVITSWLEPIIVVAQNFPKKQKRE